MRRSERRQGNTTQQKDEATQQNSPKEVIFHPRQLFFKEKNASGGIRTHNRPLARRMLLPTELRYIHVCVVEHKTSMNVCCQLCSKNVSYVIVSGMKDTSLISQCSVTPISPDYPPLLLTWGPEMTDPSGATLKLEPSIKDMYSLMVTAGPARTLGKLKQ